MLPDANYRLWKSTKTLPNSAATTAVKRLSQTAAAFFLCNVDVPSACSLIGTATLKGNYILLHLSIYFHSCGYRSCLLF